MSSQWEVVGKSKKQRNLEKKVSAHSEQKRLDALSPKLEELLPTEQYRSLILGRAGNKNSSLKQPLDDSSSSSTKSKSPVKKKAAIKAKLKDNMDSAEKKPAPPPKAPTRPRSLEQSMRLITTEDFAVKVAQLKLNFPGSELRWLSNIASYFNAAFPYECDPTFSGKSIYYPSILASPDLKTALIEFFESVGVTNLEYFYFTLIDGMVTELNNNLPVVGYKFLLQIIGQNWPTIGSNNLAKTALLRNSYQNRSNICLSILWAIGQGGYQVLTEGIKVWRNLMLPNLEMKHYTKFVVEYIEKVLNTSADQSINLNQSEFFATFRTLKANYINIPKDLQLSLKRSASIFLQKYIASSTKHANIFLTLLREIESPIKQRIEIEGCLCCLMSGDDSFKVWKMNYKKQQLPSSLLLHAIANEWDNCTHALAESKSFYNFLKEAQHLNSELKNSKKRDETTDALVFALLNVQEKSSSAQQKRSKHNAEQKKKCGCCKWVFGSILLIALIGGVLCYDTQVNGKGIFEKSATGKALKNAGLLPHVQKGWYVTMGAGARGYKWAEQHVPPYAKPVIQLSIDLYKLARNTACNACTSVSELFKAKWPVVAKSVDAYAPGLSKKLEVYATGAGNVAADLYGKSLAFIKTQVLVGRLSPENLGKTLNETQNVALEYFVLFQKKVDAYAKLK